MKSGSRGTPHICVLGAGRFGCALVREAARRGWRVTVADRNEKALEDLKGLANRCVTADITQRKAVEALNLASYDAICLTMGRELLPSLVLAFLAGAEVLPKLHCRVVHETHRLMLERIGIGQTIDVEDVAAKEVCNVMEDSVN